MKRKMLIFLLLLAALTFAGPVSYYGKLTASGGYLYGSKSGTNTKVQLKGMSFFWNTWNVGYDFYKKSVVDALVSNWKVEVVRVAHGTGSNINSNWQSLDDAVIQAAIDNDIYVIIDYHSHSAHSEVSEATTYFTYMAQKWGSYPNVIFEVYNEPTSENIWGTIKGYANTIVPIIRNYSNNLIIVGTSQYSAHPEEVINSTVTDTKANNIAYTFHFYANSHFLDGGDYSGYVTFRNRIRNAIQAGLTVFVTEWGSVSADGAGSHNASSSDTWLKFLDDNKISWCNWSVSNKDEASAAFRNQSAYTNPSNWQYSGYSDAGKYVYDKLIAHASTAVWRNASSSSSSSVSSSSSLGSSSSGSSGTTDYIDDFEDGDKYAMTGGHWYAYTDKGDKGASTLTNTKDSEGEFVVVQSAGSGNTTKGMLGMNGIVLTQGGNTYDPYVALGITLKPDSSNYDLSACSEISYKYKGAAHNFKAQMSSIANYNYHKTSFIAKSGWTAVSIAWDDLSQADWGDVPTHVAINKKGINKFAWEVKEVAGTQPTYNYLWIDDVRCNGMAIVPVPSPTSSSSSVSSSSSLSSSSSKPSSSSAASSSSMSSSSSKPSSSSAASSSSVSSSSSKPSSSSAASSSSVSSSSSSQPDVPVADWQSETNVLNNATDAAVNFGPAKDYNGERLVTRSISVIEGNSYTVSFMASIDFDGSVTLNTSVDGLCEASTALSTTSKKVTCTFEAVSDQAVLSLAVAASLPQTVRITEFSVVLSSTGNLAVADHTGVVSIAAMPSLPGVAFSLQKASWVKLQVVDMHGRSSHSDYRFWSAGSHLYELGALSHGRYVVQMRSRENGNASILLDIR